ncbi:S-adenosylmethionine-dependent methyltransferase [Halomicronema hongdechloris C2206]|uniref:S-adenosylmethionine-dependent methyltransferase n=1 Tax=Halomicronema hongdechloris C2206 TaxID=1641165 RepID=A0A1Z3HIM8_9CYAN|nr:class I SAM-dependent methyltransferase [Halomicronema hongdechloris]ASC70133.1 S-adenosylmethionine-dependent methyltransferase [Halomicronema hongdechloris C2206]
MTTTTPINQAKAEAFADTMLETLNRGAIALMTSIGHRTHLFDTMADLPPANSQQIADVAGLQERYVREWLGAMVTGGIIEHDPDNDTYHLPAEHAAALTREASPDNVAAFAQYIPLLGAVEDQIVDCFREGGGVPYSAYTRFHQVMAEDSGQTVVAALVDHILPLVPGLTAKLQQGINVMDVGCGSGRALNTMAQAFPHSRFIGYDISETAIATAQADAQAQNLSNVQFQVKDAATLEATAAYDLITTFDAVHDQAHPQTVLNNIARALKPDGIYLMQDIRASSHVHGNLEHPAGPLLYTISCMHCTSVSLAMGGPGLGAMWGQEKALEMLEAAGFEQIEVKQLCHDFQNSYYLARKLG